MQLMINPSSRRSSNQKEVSFADDVAKPSSHRKNDLQLSVYELKQSSSSEKEITDDDVTQASEKTYDRSPPDRAVALTLSTDYSDQKLRQEVKRHNERPDVEYFSYIE